MFLQDQSIQKNKKKMKKETLVWKLPQPIVQCLRRKWCWRVRCWRGSCARSLFMIAWYCVVMKVVAVLRQWFPLIQHRTCRCVALLSRSGVCLRKISLRCVSRISTKKSGQSSPVCLYSLGSIWTGWGAFVMWFAHLLARLWCTRVYIYCIKVSHKDMI